MFKARTNANKIKTIALLYIIQVVIIVDVLDLQSEKSVLVVLYVAVHY